MPDTIAEHADWLGLILWFLLPAYVVLRFPNKNITIPIGTLLFWIVGVVTGSMLAILDRERGSTFDDSVFVFTGWIFGLAYSWLLFGIRCGVVSAFRKTKPAVAKPDA